jgi:glycosyltransferase involved in cell wall biosynthesis
MISFAITTHNEGEYIQQLLNQLITHTKVTDSEIVILDDFSDDARTNEILNWAQLQPKVTVEKRSLNNNFAEQKNYLNSLCKGDYIFQIDADEILHPHLLSHIDAIIKSNAEVDLFMVPRVNMVDGLTQSDIERWGWVVNENNWVMWPDYQTRIYKNTLSIKWKNAVHEQISGYDVVAKLPAAEEWSIYHIKDIDRQRKQNDYYETIQRKM